MDVSTRDKKVKCYCCQMYAIVEKSVYGVPPNQGLKHPEHFCLRCATVLSVKDYDPKEKQRA
jgi:hypothetical protein